MNKKIYIKPSVIFEEVENYSIMEASNTEEGDGSFLIDDKGDNISGGITAVDGDESDAKGNKIFLTFDDEW